MGAAIEIISKIKEVELNVESLKSEKTRALNLSTEMSYIIKIEKEENYVRGLKDALNIIQKY